VSSDPAVRDQGAVEPAGGPVAPGVAATADLIAVLVFVVLGRRAHDEGPLLLGTAATAWPFLAGAATGWMALLASRRVAPASVRGGIAIVAVGMTLRHLTGGGVQASFVAVATTVLAVFLLGWRVIAGRVAARRR
jgi:hypothetical protein